jgi:hypothetical protein
MPSLDDLNKEAKINQGDYYEWKSKKNIYEDIYGELPANNVEWTDEQVDHYMNWMNTHNSFGGCNDNIDKIITLTKEGKWIETAEQSAEEIDQAEIEFFQNNEKVGAPGAAENFLKDKSS